MKKTRTLLLVAIALINILLFAVIFSACTKTGTAPDPCASITCQNGGTCVSGICSCPSGYLGTYCQNPANAAFAGTWHGTDCSGSANYTITADAYPLIITISVPINFTSCGTSAVALLTGTIGGSNYSSFTTNTLTYNDGCNNFYAINATGYISGSNSISIDFNVADNTASQVCQFNGTK